MLCTKIVLNVKTKQKQQFVYTLFTTCSAGNLSLKFSWTMNNLLSYCGLVDAKIRASDKDLPVLEHTSQYQKNPFFSRPPVPLETEPWPHLYKNVFNFVSLTWKLHNRYYQVYSLSKSNAMDVIAGDISHLSFLKYIHPTVPIDRILSVRNAWVWVSMDFTYFTTS